VWEDWAEILRANPGRAMLNWGRHNAQCLPVWKQSGPMLSAGGAHVEPSRAHVEPSWAHLGLMLGQAGPMLSHLGPILGLCWAKSGPCWAIGPILGLYWIDAALFLYCFQRRLTRFPRGIAQTCTDDAWSLQTKKRFKGSKCFTV